MIQKANTAKERATKEQLKASDPNANVFVSASAGSGKTTLLVDRLLRLMLPHKDASGRVVAGCDPEYILCLTYTRSGAAEMALKLQNRLAEWVGDDDTTLDRRLDALLVPRALPASYPGKNRDPAAYRRLCARRLFFKVIDLPNGMRMGTIHAFCQSVLRAFPLEASINPRFSLMEDADVLSGLEQSIQDGFRNDAALKEVAQLSRQMAWNSFVDLLRNLHEDSRVRAFIRNFGDDVHVMRDILCQGLDVETAFFEEDDTHNREKFYSQLINIQTLKRYAYELSHKNEASKSPKKTVRDKITDLLGVIERDCVTTTDLDTILQKVFLRSDGEPSSRFLNSVNSLSQHIGDAFEHIAGEISAFLERLKAKHVVALTVSLFSLLKLILNDYDRRKGQQMHVEYPDLIRKTLSLLSQPIDSAWVMYKLDGGIDHILLDEVQDTSPQQWEIVAKLSADFFSGEGRRQDGVEPTLFSVGDGKQSIFGFQGADISAFHHWNHYFYERVRQAKRPWSAPQLSVSFRSSVPILSFVDCVFKDPQTSSGVTRKQGDLKHYSAFPKRGGTVELWPLVSPPQLQELSPFVPPKERIEVKDEKQLLAQKIAHYLHDLIDVKKQISAEDVLVLMPARDVFTDHLTRALKGHQLPVANLMRTALSEHLAVKDILSLCQLLLFPRDDLMLAQVLTSPIGDIGDDQLMLLAQIAPGYRHHGESLWDCLKRRCKEKPAWYEIWEMLSDLLRQADYVTPYRLIMRFLDHFGGRTRFTRRLGRAAQEQLDSLLLHVTHFQQTHPPSLQGFVDWFMTTNKEISPRAETARDAVRIMTAHGSKGMEAELVVLPYTTRKGAKRQPIVWQERHGVDIPYFIPGQGGSVPATKLLKEETKNQEEQERNRLLYVALTRAKSHLVICGWGEEEKILKGNCWYSQCYKAFERLGRDKPELTQLGMDLQVREEEGGKYFSLKKPGKKLERTSSSSRKEETEKLPTWAGTEPSYEPILASFEENTARPFTPSRPDDRAFGKVPTGRSPLEIVKKRSQNEMTAVKKGNIIHALFQFLPSIEVEERQRTAQAWLEKKIPSYNVDACREIVANVLHVMDMPSLKDVFSERARVEQRITGRLPDGQMMSGQVDRLVVLSDKVVVCDYKSGAYVPKDVYKTPRNYLVQMAAYRDVLRALWPDKKIVCVLIWVEAVRADRLTDALMDDAWRKHFAEKADVRVH